MTTLYLYDDTRARAFEPFASTRPASEMVAGTMLIRDRWHHALQPSDVQFIAGRRHEHFDEPGARAATGMIPAGSIIALARCAPAVPADPSKTARRAATCSMWRCGAELAAIRTKEPIDVAAFADGTMMLDELYAGTGAIGTLDGWWLNEVWDFIRYLPEQLAADLAAPSLPTGSRPTGATILGEGTVTVAADAVIEPQVVFDATAGAIFVGAGSHVRAFTRLIGPCYIGREVQVMGGDIGGSSIGDVCKVRGELSSTIVVGHSNKGHDGFVGHSYLGRWVNLGAGTITSNLKNTYGTVALWTPSGVRDSGLQFLGTMFGDHVKTGIGLQLSTGTVLGAGANVYGNMPPKAVSPFSWGDAPPYAVYRADKFIETAARMMSRRHVELTDRARRHLAAAHDGRWTAETGKA
ncbi:MAG: UDP-GlcNAc diphosphorylase/GlcNAc-P N-acetyltransferase, GlmU, bacterial-type [Gemmatimonadetes bacterium]|nr:UDP-GlcNAc diphosphorylase/GlcNAc-P N-acetyltransferase, GlmU, bacterial-type [Gemmatimonadota bacterium]